MEPRETVQFALYQQGQGQVNTYVGTVTLDGEADTGDQTGDWKGINDTTKAVLTVGEKTYDITYQVTEGNFEELVIEGAATIPLLSQMHPVRVTASWCANAGSTTATCSTASR